MQVQRLQALNETSQRFDMAACRFFNCFARRPSVGIFFTLISRLGNGVFWYTLGLLLPLIYGESAIPVLIAYTLMGLFGAALYKFLKHRWVRERPFLSYQEIFQVCAVLDRYSFPSGHTLHAVSFTTLLVGVYPAMAALLIPFAILVALSRPILGLHYPSDVIAGAVIGYLIALLTLAAMSVMAL